jgi:hypothetical protein
VAGSCECSNEPSACIKSWEFLEQRNNRRPADTVLLYGLSRNTVGFDVWDTTVSFAGVE